MIALPDVLLKGPHIVIATCGGRILGAHFHLTKKAAERRVDNLSRAMGMSVKVSFRVYSLPELLRCYHLAEQRELEELERIAKL